MTQEDKNIPSATPPSPAAQSGFGQSILSFIIANALLFAVMGVYAHFNREQLSAFITQDNSQNVASDIADLSARLAAAEARISKQESAIINTPAEPSSANQQKIAELEAAVAELKQASNSTELQSVKEQLQQTIAVQQGLTQQVQQQAEKTPPDLRLVAFFQTLRAKALDGQVFQDSFQRFYAVAQAYPVIAETAEPLEVFSATGRPSLIDLQRSFAASVQTYLKEKDGVDNSLSGKVKRNLADFITIRKLEDSGDSPIAALNRAEQSLNHDRVEQAVIELADLPDDVAPFFSAWVEEAKGYYRIPQILQKLDQRIADAVMQATAGANHAP